MKTLISRKIALFGVLSILVLPLGLNADSDRFLECQDAKTQYTKIKTQWSELYTEESFLNNEFSRLNTISRDSKLGIDILHSAAKLFNRNGKLTKTEVATLNSRVPSNKGTLFTNGTVLLSGKQIMSIKEAQDVVENIHKWSNNSLSQVDKDITSIGSRIVRLNGELETLESQINHLCTSRDSYHAPQSNFQEVSAQNIADRFTQRELRRGAEVSQRQWNEIEREWLHHYYPNFTCKGCGVNHPVTYHK